MPRRKGGGEMAVRKTSKEPEKAMLENNPVVMKTPVPITKKPVTSTFPGRLEWKMSRLGMPTTSTPKLDLFSNARAVTRRDVDTAFGFDDSTPEFEGNYSALISPIAYPHHASPNNIVPVWKINPLTQRNVESELPKSLATSAKDETPGRRSQRIKKLTSESGHGHAISDIKNSKKKGVKFSDGESKSGQTNVKKLTNAETDSIQVIEVLEVPEAAVKSTTTTTTESKKPRSTRPRNRKVILEPVDEIHKPEEEPKRTEVVLHTEEKETLESQASQNAKKATVAKAKTKKPAVKLTTKRLNKKSVPEPEETKTARTSRTRTARTASKKLAIGTSSSNVPIKVTKMPQIFDFPDDEQDGLSPFSQLLGRYNEDEPKPVDGELHVDPKRILRTYSSRKRIKASRDRQIESDDDEEEAPACVPVPVEVETKTKRRGNSRQISSKKIKKQNDELGEEARKWMEEKNKEFEDVLKVPLVIENSYSESE